MTPYFFLGGSPGLEDPVADVALAAIVGGAVAELGGGEFQEGARSAALYRLYSRADGANGGGNAGAAAGAIPSAGAAGSGLLGWLAGSTIGVLVAAMVPSQMADGTVTGAAASALNTEEDELHGPFYRTERDAETALQIQKSGELWGRGPYGSDIPAVQAFTRPQGEKFIEFYTSVAPDRGGSPGRPEWRGPRPGVRVENGYAKIPVYVTQNTH